MRFVMYAPPSLSGTPCYVGAPLLCSVSTLVRHGALLASIPYQISIPFRCSVSYGNISSLLCHRPAPRCQS
jgi:hypothetical protein